MKARVRACASGLAVLIPKSLAAKAALPEGMSVDVSLAGKVIVVQNISRDTMTLKKLLAGVTKANRHREIDFGRPVGRKAS
jgi:antitoxin component of MazEF toxin-antitoxin module